MKDFSGILLLILICLVMVLMTGVTFIKLIKISNKNLSLLIKENKDSLKRLKESIKNDFDIEDDNSLFLDLTEEISEEFNLNIYEDKLPNGENNKIFAKIYNDSSKGSLPIAVVMIITNDDEAVEEVYDDEDRDYDSYYKVEAFITRNLLDYDSVIYDNDITCPSYELAMETAKKFVYFYNDRDYFDDVIAGFNSVLD